MKKKIKPSQEETEKNLCGSVTGNEVGPGTKILPMKNIPGPDALRKELGGSHTHSSGEYRKAVAGEKRGDNVVRMGQQTCGCGLLLKQIFAHLSEGNSMSRDHGLLMELTAT